MEDFIERVGESYLERKAFAVPQQLETFAKKQLIGGEEEESKSKKSTLKKVSEGKEKLEKQEKATTTKSSGKTGHRAPSVSDKDKEIARLKRQLAQLKLEKPKASSGKSALGLKNSGIIRASNGQISLTKKSAKGDKETKESAASEAVESASEKNERRQSKHGKKEASGSKLAKEANILEISPTKRRTSASHDNEHHGGAKSEPGGGPRSDHGGSRSEHGSGPRSDHGGGSRSGHGDGPWSEQGGGPRSGGPRSVFGSGLRSEHGEGPWSEHGGGSKSVHGSGLRSDHGGGLRSGFEQGPWSEHGSGSRSVHGSGLRSEHGDGPWSEEGGGSRSVRGVGSRSEPGGGVTNEYGGGARSEHGSHAGSTRSHPAPASEGTRRQSLAFPSEPGSMSRSIIPLGVHAPMAGHAEQYRVDREEVASLSPRSISEREAGGGPYVVEVEEEDSEGVVEVESSQGRMVYRV